VNNERINLMRPQFTTRDWVWLCIIMFVTFGWGASAVRWSNATQYVAAAEAAQGRLRRQLEEASKGRECNLQTWEALVYAVKVTELSDEQREAIGTAFKKELAARGLTTVDVH
jgi:hypothetical protein